ncbi:MAG: cytochrome b/b6 domain-containing protein [Gallionellaceae bacterium]|jgi:cytochrome b561|nr:cytochrome b/b6 domain-containing protein [Gallionellaceae bacterium]
MTQYSNRMMIVHWLVLVMMIAAWFLGDAVHDARHEGGATIAAYVVHALVGASVLLLTLVRLFFRSKDGVPPPLGDTPADKLAQLVKYLLYAVSILLPVSGFMQALTSDVCKAITAGNAAMLPKKFEGVMAHDVHEVLVNVLIVLVVVHVLGALKHQFVLKDNIMGRMLPGKKG